MVLRATVSHVKRTSNAAEALPAWNPDRFAYLWSHCLTGRPLAQEIDIALFSSAVRERRGSLGVRAAAKEIGDVSASTLSRIEQGRLPDLDTYMKLCRWLAVTPTHFALHVTEAAEDRGAPPVPLPERFVMHLKADQTLKPDTRQALATLIEMAYAAAEEGTPDESED